ncbi:hypothetical protein Pan97_11490 [Bremerella volcania]|uniref:Uncharacterized protein n=1 Tax=Bremerella volcania TaxID=2527984 RepID=A0A518C4N6_9BACT|nr:hypothetical protein [Bremerella volcania]QDU74144.1 hypothetical protein Pan97_11490 [Bremerella volcania]
MGMHIGLIVAETSVEALKDAFLAQCPHLEVVATKDDFGSIDDVWAWREANSQFVSAADWSKDNPGKTVYLFWQDLTWAMLLDSEYVYASDGDLLARLSQQFNRTLSFVVESAGGCASFWCYDNGTQLRQINYFDGEVELAGQPLAEEEGIDVNNYYMDETEALWRAFGIDPVKCLQSSKECLAISVIDRTDYSRDDDDLES